MARSPFNPSAVKPGENPYGQMTEYANGTDRDGQGSDGGWGYQWPSERTPEDAQALREYSRNSVRPKVQPEPDYVTAVPTVRRRRR